MENLICELKSEKLELSSTVDEGDNVWCYSSIWPERTKVHTLVEKQILRKGVIFLRNSLMYQSVSGITKNLQI